MTVYSDRARVTRTARLRLGGTARVALPLLLPGTDPASVRVEAHGAEVLRVDLQAVQASDMPVDAARRLLDKLDQLADQINRAQGEGDALRAQVALLNRLIPAVPQAEPQRPMPRLRAAGWGAVWAFVRGQMEQLQERVLRSSSRARDLQRERQLLIDEARKAGILGRRAGLQVMPTLHRSAGEDTVELKVSYLVAPARWLPTYDIQLLPDSGQVELRFAGRVSQETGEDWGEAALTLSTAVPTLAAQLPKLRAWRIGQRERFIPTPQAQPSLPAPPPPAPRLPTASDPSEVLRGRLLAHLGGARGGEAGRSVSAEDRDYDGVPDAVDELKELNDQVMAKAEAPAQEERARRRPGPSAPPPPPLSPAPAAQNQPVFESALLSAGQPVTRHFEQSLRVMPGVSASAAQSPPVSERVGLAPPPGYQPPAYAGHLPAALAGGYDLTYPALQKETVRSGQGARSIALFSRRFPVAVVRKLLPAVAPDAFLVADIKNPTGQPLPGGSANLFVGADPAGVARLSMVAPGESFTLPLGLDRALRPARNVRLSTSEKGVFSKDEITEYVVTCDVSNPYRTPLSLWLLDQIPLAGDKNVEVKLVRSEPPAAVDAVKGVLEWRLTVPPGGKAHTTFVYTLRRPRGARLSQ